MFCNSCDNGNGVLPSQYTKNATLRVIPYLITQINDHFKIRNSTFNIEQYKTSSARQVFFTELKIDQSFTLENAFFKKTKKQNLTNNGAIKEEDKEKSNLSDAEDAKATVAAAAENKDRP